MAGAVTLSLRHALRVVALGLAASAPAAAMDPTQPPAVLRAAPALAASAPAAPERPRLQGLRLGPTPSALINGRVLTPGQRWQGHTLLRLETDAAVLRDPDGRLLRLLLLPPPTSPAADAPSGNRP